MTPEDRAELERWRQIAATTPGRTARTLLDACNAIEALQAKLDRSEASALDVVDERDRLENLLNRFAYAVAPVSVIGEHSSGNDPWANALEILTTK